MIIKRLLIVLLTVGAILLIPFFAMQFSAEVFWTATDFVIAGILLFITGITIEVILRKVPKKRNRLILCGIVLGVFLIVWAELAVGILGTPMAGS
ncbi:hypothetical protein [Christiangramia sabulilitoris]|uniref:Uncharacterized protein n=1 Tax=Christiangramia sabulilitoris TaxID=2583991 RepID=A0A550I3G0_9FLAO|nr:hypothetical protein [Christiangramia sabulilitoris]TRO65481.1 hypothetical protein FGM01_08765 [Christiangramia sabulilitoris]